MPTIITSQGFRNEAIVAEKQKAQDYHCLLSPEFVVDGEMFQVLLDGHHSFEAARLDGVEPEFEIATRQQHDAIGLLDRGEITRFLEAVHMGEDYRNAYTGSFVW